MWHKRKGFTLVELTVVIVILAIISAVAVPKFINVSSDAKKAKIASVAAELRTAINLIYYKSLLLGLEGRCYDTTATPAKDKDDQLDPSKDNSSVVEGYFTCNGYPIAYVDSITRLISLDDEYITFNFGERATAATVADGTFKAVGTYRVMIISVTSEFIRKKEDRNKPENKDKNYCQVIYQPNSVEQVVLLNDGC